MTSDIHLNPEKLMDRIEYLEENRRFIQNVLEMALSLVDFQENIINSYGPENILEEADKRIRYLIPFESDALYLVNQDSADFQMAACTPTSAREYIAAEVEDMIEKGFFAWAIRERRGITIASKDRTRRLVLHVIATHSRIRGMFIGLLDDSRQQIPDTSLTLLSIILLNTANALESLELSAAASSKSDPGKAGRRANAGAGRLRTTDAAGFETSGHRDPGRRDRP
jgi:hypothetical protein